MAKRYHYDVYEDDYDYDNPDLYRKKTKKKKRRERKDYEDEWGDY